MQVLIDARLKDRVWVKLSEGERLELRDFKVIAVEVERPDYAVVCVDSEVLSAPEFEKPEVSYLLYIPPKQGISKTVEISREDAMALIEGR